MLSTRGDLLPESYLVELRMLTEDVPPFDTAIARKIVEDQLHRPIAEIFSEFGEAPVASGSIGQVYYAKLPRWNARRRQGQAARRRESADGRPRPARVRRAARRPHRGTQAAAPADGGGRIPPSGLRQARSVGPTTAQEIAFSRVSTPTSAQRERAVELVVKMGMTVRIILRSSSSIMGSQDDRVFDVAVDAADAVHRVIDAIAGDGLKVRPSLFRAARSRS